MIKPKKQQKEIVVRPKASLRKGRTEKVTQTARVPSQERSRRRQQQIIEAAETLLQTANIEDLSLYDIARQAGIAPASVHYLFGTVAAVHVELNRRYNAELTEKTLARHQKEVATRNPSWQAWMRATMEESIRLLHAKRAMAEIMLGPVLHRKSAQASHAMNAYISSVELTMMREFFVMPDIPGLERHFTYSITMVEAIWSSSYMVHGRITEEAFDESLRAGIAYMRTFLPETLHVKEGAGK